MSRNCDSLKQKLLNVDDAIHQLLAAAQPVKQTETVPLPQALGRVLAGDVRSAVNVPPHDNSAMDGYAMHAADITNKGISLPVSQRIPAGQTGVSLQPGTAARIFTGAPVPDGADAVVMQEYCEETDANVVINTRPEAGDNIRRSGEDIKQDTVILHGGTLLRPQELGLAASAGIAELKVYRKLRVALFATGDELVDPGQPLKAGQIYNSNRYTLAGILQLLGCEVIDLGHVADTLEDTRTALQDAAEKADLIISSGGVSVGEEDYVKTAVEQLGSLNMWRVAMKPGKPVACGKVANTDFIGLPGNPVSVFVTCYLFARPFIKKMQGMTAILPEPVALAADFDISKPGRRREFARARRTSDGSVALYPHQGSGVLSSAAWASGLVELPEGVVINKGDAVNYYSFNEFD